MSHSDDREAARLARLHAYDVLDTPGEEAFDRITRMVARLLDVPIVLVSLVDAERQWFKSRHGLEATETPRDGSFCTHALGRSDVLVVTDALADPRFCESPLVLGPPHVRFYAGAPLDTGEGLHIGTLCAIDRTPRHFDEDRLQVLQDFAAIVVDALEHRQAARRALEAESLLADAVEALPDGFVVFDGKDRLRLCNARYREMYHVTPDDLARGSTFAEILQRDLERGVFPDAHGREDEFYRERLAAHHAAGEPFDQTLANGTCVRVVERPTRTGGMVGIRVDITELKRQQRELETLAEHLRVQLERAEAANRAKMQFLASVSHELRTPLNAVIGFSEVLSSELFGPLGIPKYREYARDIHGSAQHLLSLVDDILDMAKLASGKFTMRPEPVALAPALEEASKIVAVPTAHKMLALTVECRPQDAVVSADPRALRQILFNLLSNAVKFTPECGHIAVSATLAGDGRAVCIRIADTGVGISSDVLPTLAQPFQRAGNAMTSSASGSGLGLAISKSMAEAMGGRLAIESAEGRGTTVTVTLPLAAPAAA